MNTKGKIILISNRNVRAKYSDERLFGDELNPIAAEEVNVALAEQNSGKWSLELVTDPDHPNYSRPVSEQVFKDAARRNKNAPWVFFVHGFNQSMKKNLKKCLELQSYGCNVVAFSWPSNPGHQALYKKYNEYKKARFNALRSVGALGRTLDKLCGYFEQHQSDQCDVTMNLVVHSLGNYLMQRFVDTPDFSRQTRIFSNVMLHQADTDTRGHPAWVEKISADSRVYVTINAHDIVLRLSDMVNPDPLGNTPIHEIADGTAYMDFTWGKDINNSHRPWNDPGKANTAVYQFYQQVFHGMRGETSPGWRYNSDRSNYELIEQKSPHP